MSFLVALLAVARAGSATEPRVPRPQDLDKAAAELRVRLVMVDAALTAIARAHNALAEASPTPAPPCDQPTWRAVAPRTPSLGAAHRDTVQAARAQLSRTEGIAASPTVRALTETLLAGELAALQGAVARHERQAAELRAWQASWVTPWLKRCDPPLRPGPGLGPVSKGEPVVVIGVVGSWICPGGIAGGNAIVATTGVACASPTAECTCLYYPQAPGAVL